MKTLMQKFCLFFYVVVIFVGIIYTIIGITDYIERNIIKTDSLYSIISFTVMLLVMCMFGYGFSLEIKRIEEKAIDEKQKKYKENN